MDWVVRAVLFSGFVGLSVAFCRLLNQYDRLADAGKTPAPPSEEAQLATADTWDLVRSFLTSAGWDDYAVQNRRFLAGGEHPNWHAGCYRFDNQGNAQVVRNAIQALEITLHGLLEKEPDLQALGERSQTISVQGLDMQAERVEKR